MELIFSHVKEPQLVIKSSWNGTQIPCKQRTGQRPLQLAKEFTVSLPDKVDAKWYTILQGKLAGIKLEDFTHNVKIFDRTPFLTVGYSRMLKELGLNFNTLTVNPTTNNFVTRLGHGVIAFKTLAKTYL